MKACAARAVMCCTGVQDTTAPQAWNPVAAAMVPVYPRDVNSVFVASSGSGAAPDLPHCLVLGLRDVSDGQPVDGWGPSHGTVVARAVWSEAAMLWCACACAFVCIRACAYVCAGQLGNIQ